MENTKNEAVTCAESQPNQESQEGVETQSKGPEGDDVSWNLCESEAEKGQREARPSQHSKKVMKHALRQQAKRRRKNTTIAAGNPAPVQRHALSPNTCDIEEVNCDTACYRQPTMAEVLASIPGFNMKPRKRSQKKLSAAAQLEQTKEGCVDLETPDSILVNSNLRLLLNKHTFSSLPPLYQYKLLQLLPHVDRTGNDSVYRLSGSGLNNEFFARACLDWRERLAEGEFTPENQAKNKAEQEKEKSRLDPWKLKHFEPTWGESLKEWPSLPISSSSTTPILHVKQKVVKPPPPPTITRLRTVGAVTRAVTSYREKRAALSPPRQTDVKRNRHIESERKNDVKDDVDMEDVNSEISDAPKTESYEATQTRTNKYESQAERIATTAKNSIDTVDNKSVSEDIQDNSYNSNLSLIKQGEDELLKNGPHENENSLTEEEEKVDEESQNNELSDINQMETSDDQSPQNTNDNFISEPETSKELVNEVNLVASDLHDSSFSIETNESHSNANSPPINMEKIIPTSVIHAERNPSPTINLKRTPSPNIPYCGVERSETITQKYDEEHISKTFIVIGEQSPKHLEHNHNTPTTNLNELELPQVIEQSQVTGIEPSHVTQQTEKPLEKSLDQSVLLREESCNPKLDINQSQPSAGEVRFIHPQLDHHIIQSHIDQSQLLQQRHNQSHLLQQQHDQNQSLQQESGQSQILQQQHNQSQLLQQNNHSQMIQQQHSQSLLQQHHEKTQLFQQHVQAQILQQHDQSQHLQHHSTPSQLQQQHNQSQIHRQQHNQSQLLQQQQNQSLLQNHQEQQHLQQVEQTHLIHHQPEPPQILQQQIDQSRYIHPQIEQAQILQPRLEQPQVLQQQIEPPEMLRQQIETLQQQIEQNENLHQQMEHSDSMQQIDPLLKSNVLMMQQMVLDVQQVNNNTIKPDINIPTSLPNEPDINEINTVITIPVSNEQSHPGLQMVNESAMPNVPLMNKVILSDVPVSNSQVITDRSSMGDEKWEVIQVNPGEKEGLYFKEEEAAILAAAWDVVGSSSHFQDLHQPVSVIPCQEELEVRLQESSLPAPQWVDYTGSSDNKHSSGHVKLELEVTLTPEVDSQVSSSSTEGASEPVRVIPPTTIVCLPPLTASAPPPPPPPASSSALPYLALTTSTPVRAVPTKPVQTKSGGGRGGRGSNNKPPPGAVNLERSYQICQAVIQNSPNRHQLRCQLKPPPALLNKRLQQQGPPRQKPRQQTVVLRHMITSNSGGIPVNMAVLPSHPSHVGGVRRSNSAPPSNSESPACGGRGRPASVGGPALSCACSLRPLVPCRRCGDFCHEDCITPSRLCITCHSA